MIHGKVVNGIEVTLRLRIFGPSGQESDIDAVIDTGFTGALTLRRQIIESLGLLPLGFRTAILANGQPIANALKGKHRARIEPNKCKPEAQWTRTWRCLHDVG